MRKHDDGPKTEVYRKGQASPEQNRTTSENTRQHTRTKDPGVRGGATSARWAHDGRAHAAEGHPSRPMPRPSPLSRSRRSRSRSRSSVRRLSSEMHPGVANRQHAQKTWQKGPLRPRHTQREMLHETRAQPRLKINLSGETACLRPDQHKRTARTDTKLTLQSPARHGLQMASARKAAHNARADERRPECSNMDARRHVFGQACECERCLAGHMRSCRRCELVLIGANRAPHRRSLDRMSPRRKRLMTSYVATGLPACSQDDQCAVPAAWRGSF